VLSSYGADAHEYTGYYVLENSPIRSARDLIGKKIGMNTLGAHHEFLTREWLAQQGLTPDELESVQLVVVPPVNTEQALREGQVDVGTLNSIQRESALERGGIRARNGELDDDAPAARDLYTNEYNPYANGTFPADGGPDGQALAGEK
jgi:ABC-type nitrate/sulfonate/bicarbonate transport system substrate-binding protein